MMDSKLSVAAGQQTFSMQAGNTLGRFKLVQPIAQGGMAEVWRGVGLAAGGVRKPVVVKLLKLEYARNPAFIQLFVQEARLGAHLNHPNVATVIDLGEEQNRHYIVMEYVPGWDLLKVLVHATRMRKHVALPHALYVTRAVAEGLSHAHTAKAPDGEPLHIVHLDVSPSNILIGPSGMVKLTDFGVARALLEEVEGQPPDHLRGKFAYMSPEQVDGRPVDTRSDIFSLGTVMYETITLKRLFRARTTAETLQNVRLAEIEPRLRMHTEIPQGVVDILRKALARYPEDRYQTSAEMADEIDKYLFDQRIRVRGDDATNALHRLCRDSVERTGPVDTRKARLTWGSMQEHNTGTLSNAELSDRPLVFQTEHGPNLEVRSFEQLIRLIHTHSIAPGDKARFAEGPWQSVDEIPVLGEMLEAHQAPEADSPSARGNIDTAMIMRVVAELAHKRATGRLNLTRPNVQKDLYFRRGNVIHVATTLKSELLGLFLLDRKVITMDQLEHAFRIAQEQDVPIGLACVKAGLIDHVGLANIMTLQLRAKVSERLRWKSATYSWYEGHRPSAGIVPLSVPLLPALTDGARRYTLCSERERYIRSLGDVRTSVADPLPFPIDELALSPVELRVFNAMQGPPRLLREHWAACVDVPGDSDALLLLLYVGLQTGHVLVH